MIPVWDVWIRLFHWSLVVIVLLNHFSNAGGSDWHEWLGYSAALLIAWRVYWGFKGSSPYARFHSYFSDWPKSEALGVFFGRYLRGKTPRVIGHTTPAICGTSLMLVCILLLAMTGWMMSWDRFFGEDWLEEIHLWTSNVLIGLATLHVAGVLLESLRHRENLIAAMLHGKKRK